MQGADSMYENFARRLIGDIRGVMASAKAPITNR
jgi:hypothetical protein